MLENLGKPLNVKDVSKPLGVSRSWVYANAHLLGGVRLGKGKGTLRFFEKRIFQPRLFEKRLEACK